MMTLQPYQYQPLEGKNWVRVLQLLSSSSRTAPLQCHIIHLDRAKLPNYGLGPRVPYSDCQNFAEIQAWMNREEDSYEAVSYAWGSPTSTKELVIEDCFVIEITEVVDTMLRWFRDEKTTISLWIDAVCLDQANRREIAEQVALMHEIYNQARKTRIWIGPKDSTVESVFDFLISFDPYVKYSGGDAARHYLEELVEWQFGEKSFIALEEFFRRRWFGRRWVLQEVSLSRNTVVQADDKIVDYERLAVRIQRYKWFFENNPERKVWLKADDSIARGLNMWSVVGGQPEVSSVRFQQGQRRLLGRLMMHHKQATKEPRDRILALRGLNKIDKEPFWDQQDEEHGSPMWMYEGSDYSFYKKVACYFISTGSLDEVLLHAASFGSLHDEVADEVSWCPNWSKERNENSSIYGNEHHFYWTRSSPEFTVRFEGGPQRLVVHRVATRVAKRFAMSTPPLSGEMLKQAVRTLLPQGLDPDGITIMRALYKLMQAVDLVGVVETVGRYYKLPHEILPNLRGKKKAKERVRILKQFERTVLYLMPAILSNRTIFVSELHTDSSSTNPSWNRCIIGISDKSCLNSNTMVFFSGSKAALPSENPVVSMMPFVQLLPDKESQNADHGMPSAMTEQIYKEFDWDWKSGRAHVCRAGGMTMATICCLGPIKEKAADSPELETHDFVIV